MQQSHLVARKQRLQHPGAEYCDPHLQDHRKWGATEGRASLRVAIEDDDAASLETSIAKRGLSLKHLSLNA